MRTERLEFCESLYMQTTSLPQVGLFTKSTVFTSNHTIGLFSK